MTTRQRYAQSFGLSLAAELSAPSTTVVYIGDVNIEYGGVFLLYSRDSIHRAYFHALEIVDLDSAVGFTGAVMLSTQSCYIPSRAKRREAYQCCGWLPETTTLNTELDAIRSYGYFDQGDYTVYQIDPTGPLSFDGWTAEGYATKADLKAEIRTALESVIPV